MVLNQCTAVQNEEEVGKAINESGVPRSEIWITSKVCQMREYILHGNSLYVTVMEYVPCSGGCRACVR